jgi:hypothetical protein
MRPRSRPCMLRCSRALRDQSCTLCVSVQGLEHHLMQVDAFLAGVVTQNVRAAIEPEVAQPPRERKQRTR